MICARPSDNGIILLKTFMLTHQVLTEIKSLFFFKSSIYFLTLNGRAAMSQS